MSLSSFQELLTLRLRLRRLGISDWQAISFLRSDSEVNRYVKRPQANTQDLAIGFIEKIHRGIDEGAYFYWAISRIDKHDMIGSICLWNFSEDDKTAELGYDLRPKYQGQGLMTEAVSEVIRFGFQNLNLDSMLAYTHRDNEKSKILLERNGFTLLKGEKDDDHEDNIIFRLPRKK